MSSIAICPECAAQFTLPEFAAGDDRAQCPNCRVDFAVAEVHARELPVAQVLPPADEFSPEFRSAETVAFSSETLAGWEERLKRAIEATAAESEAESPSRSCSSRATVLETAPEFDFHLDPPVECPVDSYSAPAPLPNTHEWFEGDIPAEEARESEAGLPAPKTLAAEPCTPPSRRGLRRSALVKHAVVAMLFGLVGVVLGQYALLWLRGPHADYMQLAQMLPEAMRPPMDVPQRFGPPLVIREHVEPAPEPREASPVETITRQLAESKPLEGELEPPVAPPVVHDDAVEPAAVELLPPPLLPATSTSADEFAELSSAAKSAVPALLSGDLKSQESARAKGHAYMALCRLAERFDFTSDLTLGPEAEREAARARALFRTTATSAAPQNDFAVIVTRWWQHAERPTQGVFLVGRVESCEPVGDRTLYHVAVAMPSETTFIPVLTEHDNFQAGDQIGVVGTIVANPRNTLRDFPLNLPQVVVAQDSFAVALD